MDLSLTLERVSHGMGKFQEELKGNSRRQLSADPKEMKTRRSADLNMQCLSSEIGEVSDDLKPRSTDVAEDLNKLYASF